MAPQKRPTRTFLTSTPRERWIGFAAAAVFTLSYYVAPAYLCGALVLVASPLRSTWVFWTYLAPILVTAVMPSRVAQMLGKRILQSYAFRQIPKYFAFEEFHELTEAEFEASTDRFIFASHPHGIFPYAATCSMISTLGAPSDAGPPATYLDNISELVPTAVATVLRRMPILNFVTGWFGIMDAGSKTVEARLRRGSLALYVGGLSELFLSSPNREAVLLSRRKGFVKLALRTQAKLVPIYYFGNTTCLSVLSSGPLADLSRKFGMSLTVFWGRWGLPLPRPVKLVMARGRPIDLPYIPNPSQDDIDKWHQVYCAKLLELFDTYKSYNPDYARKALDVV